MGVRILLYLLLTVSGLANLVFCWEHLPCPAPPSNATSKLGGPRVVQSVHRAPPYDLLCLLLRHPALTLPLSLLLLLPFFFLSPTHKPNNNNQLSKIKNPPPDLIS